MKKIIKYFVLAAVVTLFAVACTSKTNPEEAPYLKVIPAEYDNGAGEGDGFLLTVSSNLSWTITVVDDSGQAVDWIILDAMQGKGSASLLGLITRAARTSGRNCNIIVTASDSSVAPVILVFNQDKFVPMMMEGNLSNVIKAGAAVEVGQKAELEEFFKFKVVVATKAGAPNMPDDGCALVTDPSGASPVRLKMDGIEKYNVGDTLEIDQTGATVAHVSAAGYTLQVVEKPLSVGTFNKPGEEPVIKKAYIPAAAVASYENAHVKLGPCQAQKEYVGKAWNGKVKFDLTEDEGEFEAEIVSGITTTVPDGSGYIEGVVVNGAVRPTAAADIALDQPRGKKFEPTSFSITPIINIMTCSSSVANICENADFTGTGTNAWKMTFKDSDYSVAGASIEREKETGVKMTVVSAIATPFQNCATTLQWANGTGALIYAIPVKQKIYGPLEFGYSVCHGTAGNLPWTWEVTWSTDKKTWKPVDYVYSQYNVTPETAKGSQYKQTNNSHANNRYCAEFEIPEEQAITSGNIYMKVRLVSTTKLTTALTVRMNCGFYLATNVGNTPLKTYDNILAMENFANQYNGMSHQLGGKGIQYLHHNGLANTPVSQNGFNFVGTATSGRGCAYFKTPAADTPSYVVSPSLTKISGTADIKVSFKCALFEGNTLIKCEDHVGVDVNGSGTVSDLVWNKPLTEDFFSWHSCTCTIKGADATTQVKIGDINGESCGFYIDDIIISK